MKFLHLGVIALGAAVVSAMANPGAIPADDSNNVAMPLGGGLLVIAALVWVGLWFISHKSKTVKVYGYALLIMLVVGLLAGPDGPEQIRAFINGVIQ
jgi:hypothetical protein